MMEDNSSIASPAIRRCPARIKALPGKNKNKVRARKHRRAKGHLSHGKTWPFGR